MKITVYEYGKCSTCRKAAKFLSTNGHDYSLVDITVKPPSKKLLKEMLDVYEGNLKRLFNTSGVVYREQKISQKLADMSNTQAIDMLAKEGKLVKRPFLVVDGKARAIGFKEEEWGFLK